MEKLIHITDQEIDVTAGYLFLLDPQCGGQCLFIGSVRDFSQGKDINHLFFEAYIPMALRKMEELAHEAAERWDIRRVVMVHAVGLKQVLDPVVLIGTASVGRDAAFQASRFLIDRLKEVVPIWKRETYADQSVWLNAHP